MRVQSFELTVKFTSDATIGEINELVEKFTQKNKHIIKNSKTEIISEEQK